LLFIIEKKRTVELSSLGSRIRVVYLRLATKPIVFAIAGDEKDELAIRNRFFCLPTISRQIVKVISIQITSMQLLM